MTSDHDMLGMLRGVRKDLRRRVIRFRLNEGRWSREKYRAEVNAFNGMWERFYKLLDKCTARGVVSAEYRYWFNRENVISDNWGVCRKGFARRAVPR
jgi:hypothetical protein